MRERREIQHTQVRLQIVRQVEPLLQDRDQYVDADRDLDPGPDRILGSAAEPLDSQRAVQATDSNSTRHPWRHRSATLRTGASSAGATAGSDWPGPRRRVQRSAGGITPEIDVIPVHDTGGSGFGRWLIEYLHVVLLAIGNEHEGRDTALSVHQSVELHGSLGGSEASPREGVQAEIDGRGVERVDHADPPHHIETTRRALSQQTITPQPAGIAPVGWGALLSRSLEVIGQRCLHDSRGASVCDQSSLNSVERSGCYVEVAELRHV